MRTKRIATVLVRERMRQLVWHVIGAARPNRRAQVASAPDLFGRRIGCTGLAAGNLVPTHPPLAPRVRPRFVSAPCLIAGHDAFGQGILVEVGAQACHSVGEVHVDADERVAVLPRSTVLHGSSCGRKSRVPRYAVRAHVLKRHWRPGFAAHGVRPANSGRSAGRSGRRSAWRGRRRR
jgi:hypothetical protein